MLKTIREILIKHIKNNIKTYFFLFLSFVFGISCGAFTVNGLSVLQNSELTDYLQGFLQLMDNQKINSSEIFNAALRDNAKIILALWVLGVTIIGVPLIYLIIAVRGFITGFSSGFIIKALGYKGTALVAFGILPKEIIIVPCLVALGVSGINFSRDILKSKSTKQFSRNSLKANLAAYCLVTLIFAAIIFTGILVEAYITPVTIRMVSQIIS